jgi:hypothetical protein
MVNYQVLATEPHISNLRLRKLGNMRFGSAGLGISGSLYVAVS